MKIVLIASETSLWKPNFINNLIKNLPIRHTIDGVVLTSFKPVKFSITEYLKRYYNILGFRAFLLVTARESFLKSLSIIGRIFNKSNTFTIEGVCKKFQIPVYKTNDINDDETIEWIGQLNPDLLFNSCHQVYSDRLLALPGICCINRHSSLLPGYRGVYPIFWNLLHDEKEAGVTVHVMEKKLDAGKIIVQEKLPIESGDTMFSLYKKCFKLSVGLVVRAIDKLESGDWVPVINDIKPSYYSFPTSAEGKEFRKKGKRIF